MSGTIPPAPSSSPRRQLLKRGFGLDDILIQASSRFFKLSFPIDKQGLQYRHYERRTSSRGLAGTSFSWNTRGRVPPLTNGKSSGRKAPASGSSLTSLTKHRLSGIPGMARNIRKGRILRSMYASEELVISDKKQAITDPSQCGCVSGYPDWNDRNLFHMQTFDPVTSRLWLSVRWHYSRQPA